MDRHIWKPAHISKVYEALTAIADSRIELIGNCKARCYSSTKSKYYEVEYSESKNQIISNDNTAFYTDSISYPMIGYLMLTGKIFYDHELLQVLKDIHWKDINQKYHNDYDQALEFVLDGLKTQNINIDKIKQSIKEIYDQLLLLKLGYLGNKKRPPVGY